ncbi:MAG: TetR family transcriptional regulator [Frondihabitans sp.]|nr:TetR family transcriptional regulator [Frondihabitans sp.]
MDAAARLFVDRGFTATSTRSIADEVGIRQSSLYYHFPNKESILEALLLRTVEYSTKAMRLLEKSSAPAPVRLWCLIAFDVNQLVTAPHNVGTLYLLPETRQHGFSSFRDEREVLRNFYASLITQCLQQESSRASAMQPRVTGSSLEALIDIVFGMVESVIAIRADRPREQPDELVLAIAGGCMRVLGFDDAPISSFQEEGQAILGDMAKVWDNQEG